MSLPKSIRHAIWIVPLVASASWVLASTGGVADETDVPRYGPWSAPINIGPPVNTASPECEPFMTKDGLSLYFTVLEDSLGKYQHIWVTKRSSITDPWEPPEKLSSAINGGDSENQPFVTIDGHWMYFSSQRSTPDANGVAPFGRKDIYVSHRLNKREDFGPSGWQEAVNLGSAINSAFGERAPVIFEDDSTGITALYFDSNRPGLGGSDIYASTLQPDGTFGAPSLVAELSSAFNDEQPTISRDGLEMYFISDRPGSTIGADGNRSRDIWVSTRASTRDSWGAPENLDAVNAKLGGPPVNSEFYDGRPSLSFDGETLYFYSSFRPGNQSVYYDIWMTTRAKLEGKG